MQYLLSLGLPRELGRQALIDQCAFGHAEPRVTSAKTHIRSHACFGLVTKRKCWPTARG